MQQHRNQHSRQKKTVAQEIPKTALVQGLFEELGNPQQWKVHPFVLKGLAAQQVYHTDHDKIAHDDESAPDEQRLDPGLPGDLPQHFRPPHLTSAREPIVQ